jgi:hypothetical protein
MALLSANCWIATVQSGQSRLAVNITFWFAYQINIIIIIIDISLPQI